MLTHAESSSFFIFRYNYLLLYHLFMFLWTQAFTLAAAYFVTVGAVAQWYWKMDKKEV